MRAKIEFLFDLPAERSDMNTISYALDMYAALSEIKSYIRDRIKYSELDQVAKDELEIIRGFIPHEKLEEAGW